MKRPHLSKILALAAVLAGALVCAQTARAQSIFDLFGDDAPRMRHRAEPREYRRPAKSRPRKSDAAKHHDDAKPAANANAPAVVNDGPPPPYEPQMLRLNEILGGLSYLRDVCGAGDGGEWRAKASALLDAEAPSGARRERLTSAFNRGFHGFELTYHACTPNARLVIARYLDEASRLSHDISYRFGNP